MGAWIETEKDKYASELFDVAPLVGAWIETQVYALYLAGDD